MAQADDPTAVDDQLKRVIKRNAPGSNIQVGSPPDAGDGNTPFDPQAPTTPSGTPRAPIDPAVAAQRAADFARTGQTAGQRAGAAAPPPAATSTGGDTTGRLSDAWNGFIGHPENRAGLMQFAVNMLSGRGLGESIGSAAEASSRNIAQQQAEEQEAEKESLQERAQAVKESEAESYGIASRRKPVDPYERMFAAQQFQRDREDRTAWDAFVKDPLARPGILENVQKKYPGIKSKDDLDKVGNEAARAYAQEQLLGSRLGGGAQRPSPSGTPVYDQKTGALKGYWDGKKYTPGAPE